MITREIVADARRNKKWFYFWRNDSWKSATEIMTMLHKGEEIKDFILRDPQEMFIMYENTKKCSAGKAGEEVGE